MNAFTDAVIAILITILVLELRPPAGHHFDDILDEKGKFLAYVLTFVFVAVYWNNHHHLMQVAATPISFGAPSVMRRGGSTPSPSRLLTVIACRSHGAGRMSRRRGNRDKWTEILFTPSLAHSPHGTLT